MENHQKPLKKSKTYICFKVFRRQSQSWSRYVISHTCPYLKTHMPRGCGRFAWVRVGFPYGHFKCQFCHRLCLTQRCLRQDPFILAEKKEGDLLTCWPTCRPQTRGVYPDNEVDLGSVASNTWRDVCGPAFLWETKSLGCMGRGWCVTFPISWVSLKLLCVC